MIRSISFVVVAPLAFLQTPVSAHLLHERNATLKISDKSANFVVSVPVSALVAVDLNSDGVLSVEELEAGRDTIVTQFKRSFSVEYEGVVGEPAITFVSSPNTHNSEQTMAYVVVIQRVFFDDVPLQPTVRFDLFGSKPGENELRFRATHAKRTEAVILSEGYNQHTFFEDGLPVQETSLGH